MFECPFDGCKREFDTERGVGVHRSRSHDNRFQDGEWLREKYVNERMDTYEIAELCGVSSDAIRQSLKGHNIELRSPSEAKKLDWEDSEQRREEYSERMKEIGSNHSVTYWDTYSDSKIETVRQKISDAKMGESNPRFGKSVPHPEPIKVDSTGHIVKSGWEATVDRILSDMGVDYEYEGETFRLEKSTYTPDFIFGNVVIEVKGFPYQRGVRKAMSFLRQYPGYEYVVIGGDEAKDEMPYDQFIHMNEVQEQLPEQPFLVGRISE